MQAYQDALILGYMNETAETPYSASFWHVPYGYDITNAKSYLVYFKDEESRDIFIERHKDDESMAFINT